MAQLALLEKIARNCEQLGLTVTRGTSSVVVDNASNDLTVTLVDPTITSPMGGVSPSSSPYLGIGVAAPCTIKVKSASTAADTIADVLDSVVAAKVFKVVCAFANDVTLENSDATFTQTFRGHPDLVMVGQ